MVVVVIVERYHLGWIPTNLWLPWLPTSHWCQQLLRKYKGRSGKHRKKQRRSCTWCLMSDEEPALMIEGFTGGPVSLYFSATRFKLNDDAGSRPCGGLGISIYSGAVLKGFYSTATALRTSLLKVMVSSLSVFFWWASFLS
ncbi:hypothetical protein M8C21_004889 [Ambrosia artemisiifolia]|uniref:Uncharacterized protein n=1 Tax=Ambrosia artemisiifolia TaxID=4212 RepID=A0AAD5D1S6_AMBAR|nr:hypothetical protein M8C21_004889 [Ambrosia artemisiifolia]